jgi:DNA polymerase II large subunit
MQQYFKRIAEDVKKTYEVANLARAKNLDPADHVEVPLASSLAEKAVGLISTIYPQLDQKVVARILEIEKEYGSLDPCVSFKIAEEIAKEKFCKFKDLMEAIDAGIRVGFAYNTLGVVSSPIEGYTGLKLEKTAEGKDYFKVYFSGPIRSAGTTASCVVLMLIDYLRETFGFAKYDPTEYEIKRYVTENYDYHTRVNNLQYLPTEEEIEFLARRIPIQIAGEPTEDREVSNYKDLHRVETNLIRGGMCLIFSEGLAQKAKKGIRMLKRVQEKGFQTTGWDFLDEYLELHKKREAGKGDVTATYINDLVAGRPVFSHPSRSGGFRFRYGRSRVSGFSATSVHPATMAITDCFLSTGTQLKTEKPTKGCVITCCEEIDGPIVKFKNGSVKKIRTFEEGKKIYPETEEVIYLGDLLVSLGDVINRNSILLKAGYVEEWWELELKKENPDENVDKFHVSLDQAIEYSEKYKIPLHPEYIPYWTQIKYDDFLSLLNWIEHSRIADGKLILPYNRSEQEKFISAKRALEILGVEHEISTENVVLNEVNSRAFLINLGIDIREDRLDLKKEVEKILSIIKPEEEVLGNINHLSKYKIKDKAGTFIGARMGRPEKAKPRELKGSPHVLFPVGEEGGKLRSFQAALGKGSVKSDFPLNFCENCNKETIYPVCLFCGNKTKQMYYCSVCDSKSFSPFCDLHGNLKSYSNQRLNIRE